jgi:ankyrin repeat protein
MEKFKQIFKNLFKTNFTKDDFSQLATACKKNDLKAVSELFAIKKIGYLHGASLEMIFSYACEAGNIDIVKYLLTSHNTKSSFHDMHINSTYWINPSCKNGQFDVIEYLFTSSDLKYHVDIHKGNDQAFIAACDGLNFDLIKYFTSSPKLKKHANIRTKNDSSFISICEDYIKAMSIDNIDFVRIALGSNIHKINAYSEPKIIKDIIDYFILELKIPKSEAIENFLQKKLKEQNNTAKEINTMFDYRDLTESLNHNISPLNHIKPYKKIKL